MKSAEETHYQYIKNNFKNLEPLYIGKNIVFINSNDNIVYKFSHVEDDSIENREKILSLTNYLYLKNAPVLPVIDYEYITIENNTYFVSMSPFAIMYSSDKSITDDKTKKFYTYIVSENLSILHNFISQSYNEKLLDYHNFLSTYNIDSINTYRFEKFSPALEKDLTHRIEQLVYQVSKKYNNVIYKNSNTLTICHGDVHIGNIVNYRGNNVFIDFDDCCLSLHDVELGQLLARIEYYFGKQYSGIAYDSYTFLSDRNINDDNVVTGIYIKHLSMITHVGMKALYAIKNKDRNTAESYIQDLYKRVDLLESKIAI